MLLFLQNITQIHFYIRSEIKCQKDVPLSVFKTNIVGWGDGQPTTSLYDGCNIQKKSEALSDKLIDSQDMTCQIRRRQSWVSNINSRKEDDVPICDAFSLFQLLILNEHGSPGVDKTQNFENWNVYYFEATKLCKKCKICKDILGSTTEMQFSKGAVLAETYVYLLEKNMHIDSNLFT